MSSPLALQATDLKGETASGAEEPEPNVPSYSYRGSGVRVPSAPPLFSYPVSSDWFSIWMDSKGYFKVAGVPLDNVLCHAGIKTP